MQLKDKLFTLYIFVGAFSVGGFTSIANHQNNYPVNTPIDVLLREKEPSISSPVDRAVNINIFINDNNDSKENISCSDGYYFANNLCYELTKNLDDHCLTNKDCESIDNAVCSKSRCACRAEYVKSGNRCQRLIGASCTKYSDCKISNSKCKSGICQCDGAYFPARNNTECHRLNDFDLQQSDDFFTYALELPESCQRWVGCKSPFTMCSGGKCFCSGFYVRHDNVCYGSHPIAYCVKPSDCVSTSYSCISGNCANVDYMKNGKLLSSKPGISAYWVNGTRESNVTDGVYAGRDLDADVRVCRKTINGVTVPGKLIQWSSYRARCDTPIPDDEHFNDYEMLIGSDVEWTNSTYTLDKAVYGGITTIPIISELYLICRVTTFRLTAVGKLEPPLFRSCDVSYFNQIFSFDEFDVLVHK